MGTRRARPLIRLFKVGGTVPGGLKAGGQCPGFWQSLFGFDCDLAAADGLRAVTLNRRIETRGGGVPLGCDVPASSFLEDGRGAKPREFPVLASALLIGLLASFGEMVIVAIKAQWFQNGLVRKSPHWVWMLPAANAVLFLTLGAAACLLVRVWPRRGRSLAPVVVVAGGLFAILLAIPLLNAVSSLILAVGLAAWLAPVWIKLDARYPRMISILLAAAFGICGILGCVGVLNARGVAPRAEPSDPAPGRPNVLLIVMDTVRSDAVCLDAAKSLESSTPRLGALAARGASFRRAIASAPWTLPSHASMFTGRWPWQLQVGPDRPLDGRFATIAETMNRHGYATAGFVANTVFCTREYGLARGFAHFEDYPLSPFEVLRTSASGWLAARGLRWSLDRVLTALGRAPRHPFEFEADRKTALRINASALRWIDSNSTKPFFVFLNYIDAHDPYLPPAEECERFGTPARTLDDHVTLRNWIALTPQERTPERVRMARGAYEGCVAYLDEQIGRLIDGLRERGLLDNTIVVVTSDHGEHFGEHARESRHLYGHRGSLYQSEIGVPLLIVAPGRVPRGTLIDDPVSLRDLPATIVELAEIPEDAPFPGASLARFWRAFEPTPECERADPSVLAEFASVTKLAPEVRYQDGAEGLLRAIVDGPFVYHRDDRGRAMLFDLVLDPEESRNLAGTERGAPVVRRLDAKLDAATRGRVPGSQ